MGVAQVLMMGSGESAQPGKQTAAMAAARRFAGHAQPVAFLLAPCLVAHFLRLAGLCAATFQVAALACALGASARGPGSQRRAAPIPWISGRASTCRQTRRRTST